jgi:hypothetical protein
MTNGDDLSEEQLHHIFTVDEAMICQAYEVYPDADKEDIWDFQDKLRKYKFTPSSYNDLATGIGDTPSSTNFNNLLKMDRLSKDFVFPKHGDDLETLSGNTNSFFEHLSKSNKYHIESFIPKDESLTELILELIQNIEKYFKVEASFSEDFLIKSSLASLIEQLENKKIGLFFKMSIYRREEFDPVHGYMRCWETNYIKIKIKEWSGISVRTKEVLHEKLNRISLNSYEDGWRNLLEVDPIYPDDSEKEDQEKLPF